MNPGKLRNRVEIQHYTDLENSAGEMTKGWSKHKNAWASINVIGNGRDEVKAGKEQFKLTYEITMRYDPGITTEMRVVYNGKTFKIKHVIDFKELHIETHLICTLIEEGVYNE
jgi:SPP1 family predicted phage head-tail adaptor